MATIHIYQDGADRTPALVDTTKHTTPSFHFMDGTTERMVPLVTDTGIVTTGGKIYSYDASKYPRFHCQYGGQTYHMVNTSKVDKIPVKVYLALTAGEYSDNGLVTSMGGLGTTVGAQIWSSNLSPPSSVNSNSAGTFSVTAGRSGYTFSFDANQSAVMGLYITIEPENKTDKIPPNLSLSSASLGIYLSQGTSNMIMGTAGSNAPLSAKLGFTTNPNYPAGVAASGIYFIRPDLRPTVHLSAIAPALNPIPVPDWMRYVHVSGSLTIAKDRVPIAAVAINKYYAHEAISATSKPDDCKGPMAAGWAVAARAATHTGTFEMSVGNRDILAGYSTSRFYWSNGFVGPKNSSSTDFYGDGEYIGSTEV